MQLFLLYGKIKLHNFPTLTSCNRSCMAYPCYCSYLHFATIVTFARYPYHLYYPLIIYLLRQAHSYRVGTGSSMWGCWLAWKDKNARGI